MGCMWDKDEIIESHVFGEKGGAGPWSRGGNFLSHISCH